MPPEARVLDGRYELGDQLGTGGMATVYRGTDRLLDRPVAIKILSSSRAADQEFVARFRREAQAAARLNNRGVVAVYDTGSDDGMHYIVMELVEGTTLAEVLRGEGKLSPARAAQIAERVAAALSFAHANGIVHRDVKPGNVMLTASGEVKVVDFGIARAEAGGPTLTGAQTVLGTATYLSPEQAESRPVDARSDVYSLGCVLYEMLCGQPPFTADSAVAVAYKHVREQPVPPRQHSPEVPEQLERVVLRAMAKDPSARYQSAEDMREDLARAGTGEPLAAAPAPDPDETAPLGDALGATRAMAAAEGTAVMEPVAPHEAPPEPPRGRRRVWPYLVAAIIVVGTAIVGIVFVAGGSSGPKAPPSPRPTSATPPLPSASPSPVTPTPTVTESPSPQPTSTPPTTTPPPSPSPTVPTPTPSPSTT